MTFTQKWARLALLNLVVLAFVGVLLRYKILFPLPWVDHKHLLHGHSHFAFSGWVSTALYVALIHVLKPSILQQKQFNNLLWAQQISSYGMLFTFPFMGYAVPSIAFSTLSILVSFWFTALAWKQIISSQHITFQKKWFYAALVCNVVSSAGTLTLAWLMANKILHQSLYFGSVYFYLHFQYNGWFLFTVFGLLLLYAQPWINRLQQRFSNYFFWLLVISILPAWFLSMLWMRLPEWMHYAGIAAVTFQLLALYYMGRLVWQLRNFLQHSTNGLVKWMWLFSIMAFVLKIILQSFSAVPELNKYAFGIRPIVIGFLHLVLLGFVSMFILGSFIQSNLLHTKQAAATKAVWIFITGLILNEVTLMLQGIAAISFTDAPYANYILLLAALTMFSGLLALLLQQKSPARNDRAALSMP
ncbi:MAG: hypothetical protein QM725_00300 [Lacibacter sp.]